MILVEHMSNLSYCREHDLIFAALTQFYPSYNDNNKKINKHFSWVIFILNKDHFNQKYFHQNNHDDDVPYLG